VPSVMYALLLALSGIFILATGPVTARCECDDCNACNSITHPPLAYGVVLRAAKYRGKTFYPAAGMLAARAMVCVPAVRTRSSLSVPVGQALP